jgi:hypothetical protein
MIASEFEHILYVYYPYIHVWMAVLCQGIFGLGPHTWNVPLARIMSSANNPVGAHFLPNFFLLTLAAQLLLVPAIMNPLTNCLSKVSVSFLLLSIFPRIVAPKTGYLVFFGIAINVMFHTIYIIWVCAVCTPRAGSNGRLPGSCSNQVRFNFGMSSATMNAFLDLYILGIALPSLWRSKMPLRRRLGAIAVLGAGIV